MIIGFAPRPFLPCGCYWAELYVIGLIGAMRPAADAARLERMKSSGSHEAEFAQFPP
jgi:hypothetical protein